MDWAMKQRSYLLRRAFALAGIDPRVYRRKPRRPQDTELRTRMKELASERRRFGYRRLHILLKREGWEVNWKKLYRLYREEGLTVRKCGGPQACNWGQGAHDDPAGTEPTVVARLRVGRSR